MNSEMKNPWQVVALDAFNFLCCPECVYRSKEETSFQSHAIQNHPRSRIFFNNSTPLLSEASKDLPPGIDAKIFFCCPECSFKSQKENVFQIHALEKHPQSLYFFMGDTEEMKSGRFSNISPFLTFLRHGWMKLPGAKMCVFLNN